MMFEFSFFIIATGTEKISALSNRKHIRFVRVYLWQTKSTGFDDGLPDFN
jgi:hypothetical protein